MIEVSGVRSSCDTVEMKSALAWSSSCSSRTASAWLWIRWLWVSVWARSAARNCAMPVSVIVQCREWPVIASQIKPSAPPLSPIGTTSEALVPTAWASPNRIRPASVGS